MQKELSSDTDGSSFCIQYYCSRKQLKLYFRKFVFSYAAQRAYEIIRYIFPFCSRFDSVFRISRLLIINVSTYVANIFLHILFLLFSYSKPVWNQSGSFRRFFLHSYNMIAYTRQDFNETALFFLFLVFPAFHSPDCHGALQFR